MWNTTFGKIYELTENDEGFDFECDETQLVWIKLKE